MWSYSRDVNYYETDRMGVIHHSNYLRILEEARLAWMEDNLMSYAEMERQGIVVPFTESRSTFMGFLRFGDTFRVEMELSRFTGLRMHFRYRMYNATTDELCHEAETVHYTTTREDYKPASIKRSHPEVFKKLKALTGGKQEQQCRH
ncbi:MAG: thioesterase family protein [Bacillota bacterium]|nr:thioesterase family protein [Bacillota bacterium]